MIISSGIFFFDFFGFFNIMGSIEIIVDFIFIDWGFFEIMGSIDFIFIDWGFFFVFFDFFGFFEIMGSIGFFKVVIFFWRELSQIDVQLIFQNGYQNKLKYLNSSCMKIPYFLSFHMNSVNHLIFFSKY